LVEPTDVISPIRKIVSFLHRWLPTPKINFPKKIINPDPSSLVLDLGVEEGGHRQPSREGGGAVGRRCADPPLCHTWVALPSRILEEPTPAPSSSLFWRRTLTAALCRARVMPPSKTLEEPRPTLRRSTMLAGARRR
jgi:hypothetical protein